jgi:AcrR family transcriptional regulator
MRDVRTAIIDTAARLFYAHSTGAVGIDWIIAESAVAKATFYRHFPSKDDLIAAVLETANDQAVPSLIASAQAIAAREKIHPIIAIFLVLKRWFDAPDFNGCVFVRSALERSHDERCRNIAARHKRAIQDWMTSALRDDGHPADKATEAARSLMIIYDGAIVQARLLDDPTVAITARNAAQTLIDAMQRSKRQEEHL